MVYIWTYIYSYITGIGNGAGDLHYDGSVWMEVCVCVCVFESAQLGAVLVLCVEVYTLAQNHSLCTFWL